MTKREIASIQATAPSEAAIIAEDINKQIINIVVACPWCKDLVLVEQLNCRIFRHGILKETGNQMNPHLGKEGCEILITNQLIFGCGKPFFIAEKNGEYLAEECDYI